MAIQIPTTKELSDQIIADLEATFGQTASLLSKSFIRVLAKVLAATQVLIYKFAGWIFLQIYVQTASFGSVTINGVEINPLVLWGRLIGVGDPTPATQAELSIDIEVLNQGGTLDAGAQFVSSINGVTYITTSAIALDAATVSGTATAASDLAGGTGAGTLGNLDVGETIQFVNPLPDVSRDALVTGDVVTGADGETEAAYRARVIERFRLRPQGGAPIDYRVWGAEVPGVAQIYPYRSQLAGEVNVFVLSATEPDGIPTQAQLDAVAASVQSDISGLASRRPVSDFVNVLPVTIAEFDATIAGVVGPDAAQIKADIVTALGAFFLGLEPHIPGLAPLPPRNDVVSVGNLNGLVDDVVTAAGGQFISINFTREGLNNTIPIYTLNPGEFAKFRDATFVNP